MTKENDIIESQNWSAIAQGTMAIDGKQEPTDHGMFLMPTTLAFLAQQLPTLNKHSKRRMLRGGAFNFYLGKVVVKKAVAKSAGRKRLARYGFDLTKLQMPMVNYIYISGVVPAFEVQKIERAYNNAYEKGMDGAKYLQKLKDIPVLVSGMYRSAGTDLKPMRTPEEQKAHEEAMATQGFDIYKGKGADLRLKYIQFKIGMTNADLAPEARPFQFEGIPAKSEGTPENIAHLGEDDYTESANRIRLARMTNFGKNNDGAVYGMNTLSFFKDFGTHQKGMKNLRNIKTTGVNPKTGEEEDRSFFNVTLGSFDWQKAPDRIKRLYPDNIIELFNHFQVQRVSFRYTFNGLSFFDENGNIRPKSFIDRVLKYDFKPEHDQIWSFVGSISLDANIKDFDVNSGFKKMPGKNKHVNLYITKDNQVNAEIKVFRPTFQFAKFSVPDFLINSGSTDDGSDNFETDGFSIASEDIQA